ncbi:hypothetical protein BG003_007045 [Podila horticola]|nr:hypothetical protein BG003_007045 [Podila horticola]
MIASKHPGLHQTGMKLLKQWKTKAYRKEVEEFWWEQETIRPSQLVVTQSVQLHQARILQHSYKNLCHTLDKREEHFEHCGEDNDENGLSQKAQDTSDTIAKEQASLNDYGKDSESSGQSEEEVEEEDAGIRSLFEPVDWTFIMKEKPKEISLDDLDVTNTLERFRGMASTADIMEDLKDRPARLGATYVFSKDFELKWILDSISKWVDLYHVQPNVFTVGGLTEYFWRIGGESWGIESTKRRNQQKRSGKKIGGYKGDGYLREFGPKKADWLSIEGAKHWDTDGIKYKRESSWKIGRQLHDILRSRMAEVDESRAMSLNTYGFIFGAPLEELPPFYAAASPSQLRHLLRTLATM